VSGVVKQQINHHVDDGPLVDSISSVSRTVADSALNTVAQSGDIAAS